MGALVTIGELALAVQQALAETAYPGQTSGRIREVPDRRTIRYYTTIGLLDKPAEMRGRTAYYGRRHLLQLVAIKRLQARGKSLVEIQEMLTGASDSALLKLADAPDGTSERFESVTSEAQVAASEAPGVSRASQTEFWTATPKAKVDVSRRTSESPLAASSAVHVKIVDDVTLVIEGVQARVLDAEMLARIQPALKDLKRVFGTNGGDIKQKAQNENEFNQVNERRQANDNEREQR